MGSGYHEYVIDESVSNGIALCRQNGNQDELGLSTYNAPSKDTFYNFPLGTNYWSIHGKTGRASISTHFQTIYITNPKSFHITNPNAELDLEEDTFYVDYAPYAQGEG